jgi:predicted  nucleic acid-binding Zn-ribbon protein
MSSPRGDTTVGGSGRPWAPGSRSRAARNDLLVVQRASTHIRELGHDLDQQLEREPRPSERLRLLRETTNRIVRTANDAVHAYRRASRSLQNELERGDPHVAAATEMMRQLQAARAELLSVIDAANRRYPSAADDAPDTDDVSAP